jgi:hypothetical protein
VTAVGSRSFLETPPTTRHVRFAERFASFSMKLSIFRRTSAMGEGQSENKVNDGSSQPLHCFCSHLCCIDAG